MNVQAHRIMVITMHMHHYDSNMSYSSTCSNIQVQLSPRLLSRVDNSVVTVEVAWKKIIPHLEAHRFRIIVNIFLPIIFSICVGCSKEPSH